MQERQQVTSLIGKVVTRKIWLIWNWNRRRQLKKSTRGVTMFKKVVRNKRQA